MAQSGTKAGSESDGQELDCDEITLKGEDIYNKVNSVLASIQLGNFLSSFGNFYSNRQPQHKIWFQDYC